MRIIIEGHTDNSPIRSNTYPSNWHLSAFRAAEVVYSLQKQGIPEDRLKLIGFGSSVPIVPNTNKENKTKNRRVIITLKQIQDSPMEVKDE